MAPRSVNATGRRGLDTSSRPAVSTYTFLDPITPELYGCKNRSTTARASIIERSTGVLYGARLSAAPSTASYMTPDAMQMPYSAVPAGISGGSTDTLPTLPPLALLGEALCTLPDVRSDASWWGGPSLDTTGSTSSGEPTSFVLAPPWISPPERRSRLLTANFLLCTETNSYVAGPSNDTPQYTPSSTYSSIPSLTPSSSIDTTFPSPMSASYPCSRSLSASFDYEYAATENCGRSHPDHVQMPGLSDVSTQIEPGSNSRQCQHYDYRLESCGNVQFTHHAVTHTGEVHEAHGEEREWVCCGVPVEQAYREWDRRKLIKLSKTHFEYRGQQMIGGCKASYSRKDLLAQHVQQHGCPTEVNAAYL
ncbi:hypothetical protein C8Q79DRAFT_924939 [Trametes meyenii]|nr:hypothetical protein C8Q79DRAFT_924939 [Trametes meyenii]